LCLVSRFQRFALAVPEPIMDKTKVRAFADKVYADMAGAMAIGMAYLGVKRGLFRAMAGKGPMTAVSVAQGSRLQLRYVEEWLKGMTCAGYLIYDPAAETFQLADENAFLLASEGTDHFMGGLFLMAPALMRVAPMVAEAFEKGGGVAFDEIGADGIEALDWLNCGQYEHRLSQWLSMLPDVVDRLKQGGRALDVGCGVGRVSIAIAKAFPDCQVVGIDPNEHSITRARAGAAAEGVGPRLQFHAQTTAELDPNGGFDLITACDCIHDFAAPHATLREMRSLLKPNGVVFAMEPKASDRLEDNINSLGTVYYGISLFHCMTQSLAQGGPGLGTCMGPTRVEELFREAGFTRFERLDIKNMTNLFFAARA
jgi:2-polyprenyl-3-methyl-5-hydroxy-6-metoxy-1,4-benzoquinol methylase